MEVVNVRTDLFPFYEKRGFRRIREKPWDGPPDVITRPVTFFVYQRPIMRQK